MDFQTNNEGPEGGRVYALCRAHGMHSLAYSTLQPGMYYHLGSGGYVAYVRRLGQTIVLSDPVCARAEREALLGDFLREHPRAVFMQVSLETAELLKRRGFFATPVGVENELDPAAFTLEGKPKRDLRHYRNRARAAGVAVREEADSHALRSELKPVSDAWLRLKKSGGRELAFLARPFVSQPEPGVRIFTGRIGERIEGFVVLDPMFREGQVAGYCVAILRHRADSPEGTVDYINLHVLGVLRGEGVPVLSLGISPFCRIEALVRCYGIGLPTAYLGFWLMRRFGDPLYHFRGLSFHKSRYRAAESPSFTCLRGPVGVLPLVASARACRMV